MSATAAPDARTNDDAIRRVVKRLSRPHASGGTVIERAAILAEGPHSAEIVAWILAHAGQPEAQAAVVAKSGLHASRLARSAGATASTVPRRYLLPADALD